MICSNKNCSATTKKYELERKLSRNLEIKKMIQNEGSIIPAVAVSAPINPLCLYPTNVAQLIAIGPGVDSAITMSRYPTVMLASFLYAENLFSHFFDTRKVTPI